MRASSFGISSVADIASRLRRLLGLRAERIAEFDESLISDPARTARRVADLERYFAGRVLRRGAFICEQQGTCRASHPEAFYEGQLHHVGRHYDLQLSGQPLRVVVVGQEYGGGPSRVCLAKRYEQVMYSAFKCRFRAGGGLEARNSHMRGTTSVLRLLFGRGLGIDHASEFLQLPTGETCHLFDAFALVDYLLCSAVPADGSHRGRSTRTMRENCRVHFRKTLDILEPTAIVVQGKGFGRTAERAFDSVEDLSGGLKRVTFGNNEALIATFSHPSAHHPKNWGTNERTPYLLKTVKPTIEKMRAMLLALPAPSVER